MAPREPDPPADRRSQIARKLRDAAAFLPLIGVILLVSPLMTAIIGGEDSAMPRALIYIFTVWAALIILARLLARRLREEDRR